MSSPRFLLLSTLLLAGCAQANPPAAAPDCAALPTALRHALKQNDFDQAATVLAQEANACPQPVVQQDKLLYSRALAQQANAALDQGRVDQAEALINRAEALSWAANSVRGHIAARRQDWKEAALQYHLALDLLDSPGQLDAGQDAAKIRTWMYQLASEAQAISWEVSVITTRDGGESLLLGRRVDVEESIPVQFDTDSATLNDKGRQSADHLAAYLRKQDGAGTVTVVGHTDERGSEDYNLKLSRRRAETIVAYLKANGVKQTLIPDGKGESQPKPPTDSKRLNQDQTWAIQRRVEIIEN